MVRRKLTYFKEFGINIESSLMILWICTEERCLSNPLRAKLLYRNTILLAKWIKMWKLKGRTLLGGVGEDWFEGSHTDQMVCPKWDQTSKWRGRWGRWEKAARGTKCSRNDVALQCWKMISNYFTLTKWFVQMDSYLEIMDVGGGGEERVSERDRRGYSRQEVYIPKILS